MKKFEERAKVGTWLVLLGILLIPAVSEAQSNGVREVTATDRSVIQLNTRLRYTSMIVLPAGEEILDVVCGDKEFWQIESTQNIAHVKPSKEARRRT